MRGRVLVLIGLIILLGAVLAAVLLLGNRGGGEEEAAATPTGEVAPVDGGGAAPAFTPTPEGMEPVVIAIQDLPRGTLITEENLEDLLGVRFWPVGSAPTTSFTAIEQVVEDGNKYARTDIPRESPVVRAQLVADPTDLATIGSDAAAILETGLVAISVPLDLTGLGQVAYGLQPGDHVDVIMSFLFIDVDEEFQTRLPNVITVVTRLEDGTIGFTDGRIGRSEPSPVFPEGVVVGPSELQQRPRLVTQRTIQDAVVMWVGWFPEDGKIYGREATPTAFIPPPAALQPTPASQAQAAAQLTVAPTETPFIPVIMTIGVPPQEAVVLTWAIDAGIPVTYALRSVRDAGTVSPATESVTLEYMINTYSVRQAGNLPFAIEPAITDIRRFDISTLRTFDGLIAQIVQQ
jgi:pilus assembly protein CpaB